MSATGAAEPVRSVLYDVQERQGAEFDDFDGWMWTLDFGDVLGEYESLRSGVGMWDVYALVKWEVTGRDAQAVLQRGFTNNLANQAVGQVRYGAFVDADGRMLDEGTIFRRDEESYFAFTNSDGFAAFAHELSPQADVAIVNRLHEMPLISLQGPLSRELLQSLSDFEVSSLRYFRFATVPVTVAGVDVFVSRTGFSGELGFELIPAPDDAERLWSALADAGARPVGYNAIDIARVEAGLIVHGFDYSPGDRSPFDVGLDAVVSLAPEIDYVGKTTLQEVAAAPPHRFKTLHLSSAELPEPGVDVTRDGAVVGVLTSPTGSPRFGPIALAVLDTEAAHDGTVVAVGDGSATVAELSIFDPEKRKPRV